LTDRCGLTVDCCHDTTVIRIVNNSSCRTRYSRNKMFEKSGKMGTNGFECSEFKWCTKTNFSTRPPFN
jgi:hypothetical protein